MLGVEEALQELEKRDPRMGRIVECRFFGGMSVQDTAEALGTSPRTVEREWARARAYLYTALHDDGGAAPPLTFRTFLGEDFVDMTRNQVRNLQERRIRTVSYICAA